MTAQTEAQRVLMEIDGRVYSPDQYCGNVWFDGYAITTYDGDKLEYGFAQGYHYDRTTKRLVLDGYERHFEGVRGENLRDKYEASRLRLIAEGRPKRGKPDA